MAKLTLYSSSSGEFELPASCHKCASCVELSSESRVLQRSTPLQGLALIPWLIGAPLASEGNGAYLLTALFASVAILYATRQTAQVKTYICARCRQVRSRQILIGSALAGLGLLVTFVGPVWTNSGTWVLAGLSLVLIAGLGVSLLEGSSQFKLLSRKRDQAVPEISDRSPVSWQSKDPSLS